MARAGADRIPFGGAKIAVIVRGAVLCLRRDATPGLPHAGLWDLPGGGRENGEGPVACALRELDEEFGLAMARSRIVWRRFHPEGSGGAGAWFFGALWPGLDARAVRFGDEGQGWALMPVTAFLARDDATPALQARLRAFRAAVPFG